MKGRFDLFRLDSFLGIKRDRDEDDLDAIAASRLTWLKNNRYLNRGKYRKTDHTRFYEAIHDPVKVKDNEFLNHYRVNRESFADLVELVKDHPVFESTGKRKQAPPEYQLLVLLKYRGTNGNGANAISLANHFGIGVGTVRDYRKRASKALLALEEQVVVWPDEAERKEIAARIYANYGFPHCVGVIDGTLLPLAFEPTEYHESYLSRKKMYAVNMLVINDDTGRVRYFLVGWPGSVSTTTESGTTAIPIASTVNTSLCWSIFLAILPTSQVPSW